MKEEIKVYISQLGRFDGDYLFKWFAEGKGKQVFKLEDADVVVFPGGADIHPVYYGEKIGSRTSCHTPTDTLHVEDFRKAINLNKFIVGICRGAQLACIMSGGKMIQHIEGHIQKGESGHLITDKETKRLVYTNSSHHQMMFPYDMPKEDYELIAYREKKPGTKYFGQYNTPYMWRNIVIETYEHFAEPEIIYFTKSKALGFQHHPEMMHVDHESNKYARKLFNKYYSRHLQNKKVLTV